MLTESWVEGKSVEEKRCTTNRENRSIMRIVKQNRFKNLGELHKEWAEAGVKASRATTHRRVKEFGYSCCQRRLIWAKEKKNWTVAQWSKVLFSDESKFCISLLLFFVLKSRLNIYIQQEKILNMSPFFLVNIFLKVLLTWHFHQMSVPTQVIHTYK